MKIYIGNRVNRQVQLNGKDRRKKMWTGIATGHPKPASEGRVKTGQLR